MKVLVEKYLLLCVAVEQQCYKSTVGKRDIIYSDISISLSSCL